MQLRARADATIDVRSKSAISARVVWGPWYQIMPYPRVPATALPASTQVPALAPSKSWPEFNKKIVPCLQKFYSRAFRHPVHIPAEEQQEMLEFLRRGPPPVSTPAWIKWTLTNGESETCASADGAVQPEPAPDSADGAIQQEPAPAAADGAVQPEPAPAAVPPRAARKKVWRPFLAPRSNPMNKKCRCEFVCCCMCESNFFITRTHTRACDKVRQHDAPKSDASGLPFKSQACGPGPRQSQRGRFGC